MAWEANPAVSVDTLNALLGVAADQPIPADKLREGTRSNNSQVRALSRIALGVKRLKQPEATT